MTNLASNRADTAHGLGIEARRFLAVVGHLAGGIGRLLDVVVAVIGRVWLCGWAGRYDLSLRW